MEREQGGEKSMESWIREGEARGGQKGQGAAAAAAAAAKGGEGAAAVAGTEIEARGPVTAARVVKGSESQDSRK
eukprot:524378-Hanusia_phi.AAC.4